MNAPLPDPWTLHEAEYRLLRSREDQFKFVVRYATLAPSNRNSQPWRFSVGRDQITIHADLSRWQQVSDSHQRELHISLGCALENLLVALEHFGFGHIVTLCPDAEDFSIAAQVAVLDRSIPSYFRTRDMFTAIVRRRTHHGQYLRRTVSSRVLGGLSACNVDKELVLFMTRGSAIKKTVTQLAFEGDALSLADSRYREELADSIGAGSFGGPWLLALAQQFAVAHLGAQKTIARGSHKALASSPVFGLISGESNHRAVQIKAGQLLERVYLVAASHGLSLQPISQLLETEQVQARFARLFRAGGVPLMPFRLGYPGSLASPTPRRSIEEVCL
jgi:hypothetical protein